MKFKKNILAKILVLLLLLLQLALLFYFGNRKSGFHEDEFYSYYSTNKTAGLFVNDRQWQERDNYRNDFVVLEGEQFRYDVVKQMQSWDVHPPFYYYLLHTVCSLFPGVFSKWLGIAVNLIAFVPCFFLLFYLVFTCMQPEKSKEKAFYYAFAVCLFWGFGAAVISGVMFIRMYQWLTLFVLLCACLHMKAMKQDKYGWSFFVPLAVVVFLGFLTQYYYIIFHFFLGAGFCVLLLLGKKIKELFAYVISCAIGLLAALLYYPSALSHIFRGYRGTEAVSEFSNAENTFERLRFFVGLFDDYVMNDMLSMFLLAICLVWLFVNYKSKKKGEKVQSRKQCQMMGLLLFASLGYFFTISKTALLLGETSNRYQLPIYGILLFLLLYYLLTPIEFLMKEKKKEIPAMALLVLLLLVDIWAIKENKVFFLYEDEKPMMEAVKESPDTPVVVFYREESPTHVWWISDQLMEASKVYFACMDNPEQISDEIIAGSDKMFVYIAEDEEAQIQVKHLLEINPGLKEYQKVGEKNLWTLYELD